jgi:hypothetical protein
MSNEIWRSLSAARARLDADRENAARPATVQVRYTTTGVGRLVTTQPFRFDVPFIEPPFVATSFVLASHAPPELMTLPMVSAGVYRWQRSNGWYRGATLLLSILSEPQPGVDPAEILPDHYEAVRIQHHFTFTGTCLKLVAPVLAELEHGKVSALPLRG